jgi:hypothetical protein
MDEGPNPGENEEPGATGPFFAGRMKKKAAGGLAGTMAGDALTPRLRALGGNNLDNGDL